MSDALTLPAEARERAGKGASRQLRREGRVPAVIYGGKEDPIMIHVEEKELVKQLMTGHFMNSIVEVEIGGKKVKTLPKDVALNPVTDRPEHADFFRLAKGGNGGFGNAYFTTSTNRAPKHANPGLEGQEMWIWLRLKLIADAGLVGLPNAGKSTFLASVTAAKPKIADYPFTTLHPGLGVVRSDGREFVLADIPGLIEGAHEGVGLGDKFLAHVERCRVLLHLVDGTSEHAGKTYKLVRGEIEAYGNGLAEKPEIVALSKADALDADTLKSQVAKLKRAAGRAPLVLSSASRKGVPEALRALQSEIDASAEAERKPVDAWQP